MGDFANESIVSNSSGARCHRDTTVTHLVFPVLYTLVFLLGLVLNSLACWAFFHIPSTSTFIIYLKNILVSDFIMTLMLPLKILTDSGLGPWQLKAFVCRFSAVVFYDTMYISIVLLGLIASDRFLKIVRPFGKFWVQNLTSAKILAGLVWLFFLAISLPNMILSNKKATPQSVKKCASLKSQLGLKWHEAVSYICQFIFWTVLILMFVFYTVIAKKVYESYIKTQKKDNKSEKRIKGKVFIIFTVFFLCFAPFHFSRVPYNLSQTSTRMDGRLQNRLFVAKESTLWLAATNVCTDPLIYLFLCKPFVEKVLYRRVKTFRKTVHTSPKTELDTRLSPTES
ncbi:PREDICTED: LOW QUALITY PROTEIN: P2Y purinoceptor 13 [Apaloderma vittatum]|uniref:LOW QUALITY PROTEIN: P2Y purinoceptor 13 n=1 Tax=Apaloderma vittatum TaxID=57397 RepID=UPI0005217874|nr:PREDICTED: LOW QUALITY PROTEIN: P2Y purinoceptor 13 [Apaloderma vittatum]